MSGNPKLADSDATPGDDPPAPRRYRMTKRVPRYSQPERSPFRFPDESPGPDGFYGSGI